MDELVQWLSAQLDADQAKAQAIGEETWEARYVDSVNDYPDTATVRLPGGDDVAVMERYSMRDAEHIAAWDPARVLREIDAKRRIVDRYAWLREHGDTGNMAGVLQVLALPYANQPGYRDEWRP
ncbi:DUF6221 family protein [Streptomyces anthocyanicus]|uniref:DUF6221 family protein n=1 Tax=Streptomyces anthocyanicus TaxID=68174 RepID=UPI00386FFCD3|nr:DUF6221 family protein [Streptomyces anthocyanicus]